MAVPDISSLYKEIAEWALSQQEYEKTHGQPASLTGPQRKAIQELHYAIKPAPPEPEVGETNWIGLLHRFRDAYPDENFGFAEESLDIPGSTSRFKCFVHIKEYPSPFPGPGHGLTADGNPPTFLRKKDAKQYAAKCAIEWLRANGLMPTSGEEVKFKSAIPGPPPAKKQKRKPTIATPPLARAIAQSHSNSNGNPLDPTDQSATNLVDEYCKKLQLTAPKYELVEQDMPGFFSGHPVFVTKWEEEKFPRDVGRVKDVLGKKVAKEMIAEKVLKELRRINDERQALIVKTLAEDDARAKTEA